MIKATTDIFGIIGDPIEHSLSPILQNWFFQQFALDAVYVAFHVYPKELKNAISGLHSMNIKGLNVTLPHKAGVVDYCGIRSREVELLNVANTLSLSETELSAHVTDSHGFKKSLGQKRVEFKNSDICMLGAGGAARSILFALAELEPAGVFVYNRTREKAEQLVQEGRKSFGLLNARSISKSELNDVIHSCRIVINTTSVGMYPNIHDCPVDENAPFSDGHFVYDLIYNPLTTRFLRIAKEKGAAVQNGLDMLIFQGLESLRIWKQADLQLNSKHLTECRSLLETQLYE